MNVSGSKDPDALYRGLKGYGMIFIGPVIIESFMESVGLLNHHEPGCFLYKRDEEGTGD